MTSDIDNLSYTDLQTECARLGLGGKGSRAALSERLDRFLKGDESQKVYTAEDDNSDISPEDIEIENPTTENKQILANSEIDEAEIAHNADWEALSRKLDIVLAGRVQYFLQTNSPNNYSIVFKGSARKSECINLTAGHATIIREATRFVKPAIIAPITGGDTPGMAMDKFQQANPTG